MIEDIISFTGFCKQIPSLLLSLIACNGQGAERCNFLDGNPFQLYCRGVYPQEVAIKYHDEWIKIGEPFVIHRSLNINTEYIVTFRKSPIHLCKIVTVTSATKFNCIYPDAENNVPVRVIIKNGTGICYNMNLNVMDDLIRICLHQNKRNEYYNASTNNAVFYNLEEDVTSGAVNIDIQENLILSIYHISHVCLIIFMYKYLTDTSQSLLFF